MVNPLNALRRWYASYCAWADAELDRLNRQRIEELTHSADASACEKLPSFPPAATKGQSVARESNQVSIACPERSSEAGRWGSGWPLVIDVPETQDWWYGRSPLADMADRRLSSPKSAESIGDNGDRASETKCPGKKLAGK